MTLPSADSSGPFTYETAPFTPSSHGSGMTPFMHGFHACFLAMRQPRFTPLSQALGGSYHSSFCTVYMPLLRPKTASRLNGITSRLPLRPSVMRAQFTPLSMSSRITQHSFIARDAPFHVSYLEPKGPFLSCTLPTFQRL